MRGVAGFWMPDVANQSFKIRMDAATQTITNASNNYMALSVAEFDYLGVWAVSPNPTRVTPLVAGIYTFTANCRWSAHATGVRVLRILRNQTDVVASATIVAGAALTVEQNCSGMTPMNGTTDYVEAMLFQTSGADLTINNGVTRTNYFGGFRIPGALA